MGGTMKKLIIIAAALVLSGCGAAGDKTEPIGRELDCTAEITSNGYDYSAKIERTEAEDGAGAYNFTFTAPEGLAGVSVSLIGESCTLTLGDQSESIPLSELPAHGMLLLFSEAAEGAINGEPEGKVRGIPYKAEAEDGRLKRLELGDGTSFELS